MTNVIIQGSQLHWLATYEASGYKVASLAEISKIDEGSFRKYLNCDRAPRKANHAKMEQAMKIASNTPRLRFHPSYGYATPEQIERLRTMGAGPQMQYLLKQIEEQTRNKGKFK